MLSYHEQPAQAPDIGQPRGTAVAASDPFPKWRIHFTKGEKESSTQTWPMTIRGLDLRFTETWLVS